MLIVPSEHVLSIEDSIVNCADAEHVALCSQSRVCQVFDLQDLWGDEAWSAASDEDVLGLIYSCSQPEVNDLY